MARVVREQDRITFFTMRDPAVVSDFIAKIRDGIRRGYEEFSLNFALVDSAFPNVIVPLAAIIQHYRTGDLLLKIEANNDYLQHVSFEAPVVATQEAVGEVFTSLDRLWAFGSDAETHRLLRRIIADFETRTTFQPGVLLALEWCLTEVLDNVLVHSESSHGFLMAQLHASRAVVCVADQGQGIYRSLRSGYPMLSSDEDALTAAIRSGTTRDPSLGQGNGLWGLAEIIRLNQGQLVISSRGASLRLEGDSVEFARRQFLPDPNAGTVVDFQLVRDNPVNLQEALQMSIQPINLRFESREDAGGECRLKLSDLGLGTGTRAAGEKARNIALNAINEGATTVILDLEGTGVVSSSYADELIGKLLVLIGFVRFTNSVQIINADPLQQMIVQKAVAQRMMESLGNGTTAGPNS